MQGETRKLSISEQIACRLSWITSKVSFQLSKASRIVSNLVRSNPSRPRASQFPSPEIKLLAFSASFVTAVSSLVTSPLKIVFWAFRIVSSRESARECCRKLPNVFETAWYRLYASRTIGMPPSTTPTISNPLMMVGHDQMGRISFFVAPRQIINVL